MRRYLGLLALAVTLGAAGWWAGRGWNPPPPVVEETERRRVVSLDIAITPDEHIVPAVARVPKDHRVILRVTNRNRRTVTLTLMGYQDRLGVASVAPDSTWQGEFVADRPGEGFAWILEGGPVGRLEVAGPHLVEGHR